MNKHQKYDDETLLNKFYQSQEKYWVGILLQRYTLLLLGVCMKYLKNEHDAQDAVQQVFYKVLTELPKSKVTYFKSWIYTIARNHCLLLLRAGKSLILEELKVELSPVLEDDGWEKKKEKEKLFDYMESALCELNEEQKTCISLFYLNNKSYSEIAEETGFTTTQVKSHIQNGKRNLKNLIEKKQEKNG
ncbi:RNA polymerase sigma factor [Arachidicoccus sp.]|uniref:RNA polymerase sigma factor n=1 Tax=Arachidicoccus sp. TaxID=1872624 RepID=UPI003D1F1D68